MLIPSKFLPLALLAALALSTASRADDTDAFGKQQLGEAAFMGIFYDLSQTEDGKPSGVQWSDVILDFVKSGWDEDKLNKFYHASKPLFATQIWIPTMLTIEAPMAFHVEKRAPHATWTIHYKGQIVPPEDGTYRFVGFGDDILVVAINQKLVLASDFTHLDFGIPEGTPQNGPLKSGLWFDAKKSEPMDLDVLCCDNGDPNGVCASFVLIEQKGKTYQMQNGFPVLPVFQVAPFATPDFKPEDRYKFPFSKDSVIWKALQ